MVPALLVGAAFAVPVRTALDLQGVANLVQMWHLPHLNRICYSFGPDLLTCALRRYGVNPFFRPVSNTAFSSICRS